MRLKGLKIAASVVLATMATAATSATITRVYDVSAYAFGGSAPVDPVAGTFTVSFDNTVSASNVTNGISVSGLNINLGSALGYSYDLASDRLSIGGIAADVFLVSAATDDFAFSIFDPSSLGNKSTTSFIYSADGSYYSTFNTLVTASAPLAPVPEPASWALMIGGFGLVGGTLRARSRKVAFMAA